MHNTRLLLIIATALLLGACAFTTDDAKNEAAKKQIEKLNSAQKDQIRKSVEEVKLSEADIKVEFFETNSQGVYQYRISWPTRAKYVYVGDANGGETRFEGFVSGKIGHSTTEVFKIVSKNEAGFEASSFLYTMTSPEDLIVTEKMSLSGDKTYDVRNVYFNVGGVIETNGYHLTINAESIWVEDFEELCKDGRSAGYCNSVYPSRMNIESTLPGVVAKNENQISGSHIKINTSRSAKGILRIAAVGFDGQKGLSGDILNTQKGTLTEALDPAKAGANGQDGKSEQQSQGCVSSGYNMDIPCRETVSLVCTQRPTNGADGQKGDKGTSGQNGQVGGKSPDVSVNVKPADYDFTVQIWVKPGEGGMGGEGAQGFMGGSPGLAGKNSSGCAQAQNGKQGERGDVGSVGAQGKAGAEGVITVTGAHQEIKAIR